MWKFFNCFCNNYKIICIQELPWRTSSKSIRVYVHAVKLHMCLDDPIYQQMETKRQFNGEMNAFLKRSQMFWKLLTGKMIMLSNSNLLMTKSAIPVTLKNRWCYNNVGTTTDVDLCTFDFWKMLLPIQFVIRINNLKLATNIH